MEFKGIAEILDKFTFAQRILALLMLLMTIVLVTLGPKLIDALTTSNTECVAETKRQEKRITYLEKVVDTLDMKIVTNQRKFTNESAQREAEFVAMLDELKDDIGKSKTARTVKSYPLKTHAHITSSEGCGDVAFSPEPDEMEKTPIVIQEAGINSKKVGDIMKKIETIKKKVKNDAH
jgi:hypothetical protein